MFEKRKGKFDFYYNVIIPLKYIALINGNNFDVYLMSLKMYN